MDIPFMVRLSMINQAGEIEPERAIEISSKMVVDFFNKNLNKENIDLLGVANQYPELVFEKIN